MKKKARKIFLTLLLIMGILCPEKGFAQNEMVVHVKFELDSKRVDFANEVQLIINVNGQEIRPLMYVNGFVVPDFKGMIEVDVCFIYKGYHYIIKGLPVSKFKTDWVFGILSKPIDKRNKKEYYIKFNPKDGGDGTQVMVTQ